MNPRRFLRLFISFLDSLAVVLRRLFESSATPVARDSLKKILIVSYCGLGDMVFQLPLLAAIRTWFPNAKVTLITGNYSAASAVIEKGVHVDEVRTIDWVGMSEAERRRVNREIGAAGFDACLVTATSPVRFFLPAFSRIPLRAGHSRTIKIPCGFHWLRWLYARLRIEFLEEEFYRRLLFNRRVIVDVLRTDEHDIERYSRLGLALGIARDAFAPAPSLVISPAAQEFASSFLMAHEASSQKLLGLSLGVSKNMTWKMWGAARAAHIAERVAGQFGLRVILFGSKDEAALEEEFKKYYSGPVISAIGLTTVAEMAALIARCSVFFSNDSGPSKLAMAMGTPTAIVWGPSDRFGAGPWDKSAHLTISHSSCRPRLVFGLAKQETSDHNCLSELSVDDVYAQFSQFVEKAVSQERRV